MKVLVLDDSTLMRGILAKNLLEIGFSAREITEAHNGAEAIRKINSEDFDLFLLDIVMDGIDGVAVLKEVKQLQPKAKVIMVSTFTESNTVKKLIDMGIDDFVVKPFTADKLREAIHRVKPQAGRAKTS